MICLFKKSSDYFADIDIFLVYDPFELFSYFDCPVHECNIRYGKKFRIKEHVKEAHPEVDLDQVGLGGQPKKM